MSTAARPTIAQLTQSTAQQLLTVSQQTISEEIFADAVAHVQREIESPNVRRSSKKIAADKALLSDIASVRDIAQVAGIVERKIDSSMIWGRTAKIRPDGKFQRVVSTMLHHKSLLDSIVPVGMSTSLIIQVEKEHRLSNSSCSRSYSRRSSMGCHLLLTDSTSIVGRNTSLELTVMELSDCTASPQDSRSHETGSGPCKETSQSL
jgi:hypothetical protein